VIRQLGSVSAVLVIGWFVMTSGAGIAVSAAPPQVPTARPVAIDIPRIDSRSSLINLGLNSAGELEAPPVDQPQQAGWYAEGIKPGDTGPAVIAGHVNGRVNGVSTPGIFKDLHLLRTGDQVHILRSDNSEVSFVIMRVEQYDKDKFPTQKVYGDTKGPELRVITCGGDYDSAHHRYLDNIVAYGVEIP
jgi:hypothetical protein